MSIFRFRHGPTRNYSSIAFKNYNDSLFFRQLSNTTFFKYNKVFFGLAMQPLSPFK